jgi:predicted DNA-binding transcriptional regulator AlpA
VQVVGVYRHLVSVNQIGSLTGIAPETVHLWLKRDDSFPKPYLNIDGYRMWVWGDVAAWLQETFHLAAAGHLEMLLRERVSM